MNAAAGRPRVGLIWAQARGGVIGRDGGMPWHVPEDLAYFRRVTGRSPVIMGRRTWESLPERFRPLPGRRNIVVTSNTAYAAGGAEIAETLERALQRVADWNGTVWVMGGGQLYRAALPVADELRVTQIALDVDGGDTVAPAIGPEWRRTDRSEEHRSDSGVGYRFERYERAHGQSGSSRVA